MEDQHVIQTKPSVLEILCNIIAIVLYLNFAVLFTVGFMKTHDPSILLYAFFDSVVVVLLIVRDRPVKISTNIFYWIAAMGGTWSGLLTRPYPDHHGISLWLIPQIVGIVIAFAGLLSLNKSFGLIASNRGIHTQGMYRFIRHPLYAGYSLTLLSFLAQHFSSWNAFIFVFNFSMQIWRIFIEEKFLSSDLKYADYKTHTKWRLVPGLW